MRAGLVALSLVAAGVLVAPSPAVAAEPVAGPRTVTLLSGDRLLVSSDGRSAGRVPGSDRDGVALITQFAGGRLRIIPADAVPLLNADRLDPRLFDVTGLLAAGYDDARADLPLIMTFDGRAEVGALVAGAPAQDLPAVQGSGVRVTRAQAATLWTGLTGGRLNAAYRKIWLDGVAKPAIDVSVPLVGAPAAWAAGLTGGEVKVGVLDTGVDADHPDLAGAIAETADFTGGGDGGVDRAGHGTAVASILAGSGAASGGRYRGMAPDVRLYSATVCASATACAESSILQGMRWAAQDKGVKVVNLSIGHADGPGADLLESAVDRLTAEFGTLFVVAAGNDKDRVWSPASAASALAVGATTEDDTVADFSDPGDAAAKPDIMAPGVDITAARSGDSKLTGTAYTTQSGTSMAAPHVAGAAALLTQQHPGWGPAQIKATLIGSATPLEGADAGRLDVAKAVAEPGEAGPVRAAEAAPAFPVTVSYLDRDGAATVNAFATAYAADGPHDLSGPLPAGEYVLDAQIFDADGSVTLLNQPRLVVDGALDIVLDARLGKPVSVTSPGGRAVYGYVGFARGDTTGGVQDDTLDGMTAAQIGEPAGDLRTDVAASWDAGSLYSAAWSVAGEFVTGFTRAPKAFVPVRAVFGGRGTGMMVRAHEGGWGYTSVLDLPATRTDHLLAEGGVRWGGEFSTAETTLTAAFAPATTAPEEWNQPLFGPAFAPGREVSRTGDRVEADPVWRSDSSGHGAPGSGRTTVTRARVVNEHDGDRTEWNFPAARTARKTLIPLPVVRFTPRPGNALAFTVQHQAGGGVTDFGLEVSYDDGHTWQRPFFTRVGDRGVAALRPPAGSWVSVRATATNSAGNSVRQTIIRGYAAG